MVTFRAAKPRSCWRRRARTAASWSEKARVILGTLCSLYELVMTKQTALTANPKSPMSWFVARYYRLYWLWLFHLLCLELYFSHLCNWFINISGIFFFSAWYEVWCWWRGEVWLPDRPGGTLQEKPHGGNTGHCASAQTGVVLGRLAEFLIHACSYRTSLWTTNRKKNHIIGSYFIYIMKHTMALKTLLHCMHTIQVEKLFKRMTV